MKNDAKYPAIIAAATMLLSGTAIAGYDSTSKTYDGQELATRASVNIQQARAIALKAHPGKIVDQELEKEKGGTGLRYSFDIKQGTVTYEVGVDAKSGKVLENAAEGKNPD
jgi:uncharacterized membrane protein YkoI